MTKPKKEEFDENIDMTLRAVVDGNNFSKIKLPSAIEISRHEAEVIAMWARPFSGTCMTDIEIHVSDIKPSNGLMVIGDLPEKLGNKIRPMMLKARLYGFGLRIMRELTTDPYKISIVRRAIDVPQLTITARSMKVFLGALGLDNVKEGLGVNTLQEARIGIDVFAQRLDNRSIQCMDLGVAHYREFSRRIVEYGMANGAVQILWGPERRGAVAAPKPEISYLPGEPGSAPTIQEMKAEFSELKRELH